MKAIVNPASKNTLALTASCLSALMFGLEISSVPVILPTLEKILHSSFKDMQWIMNSYTIACTSVLMATGTLADKYGRKVAFIVSVVLFGISSFACGTAQSVSTIIIARAIQGASGGAMLVCQIAILSFQFRDSRERAKAFGYWGIVFGIGLGFGPLIGGGIVAISNWQWVFLIHTFIAAVTLWMIVRGVHEVKVTSATKLDVAGMLTLSSFVFLLSYFIIQGSEIGFTRPLSLAILGLSILSLVAFVAIETTASSPMFDFSVFKIRPFTGAIFGSIGMNTSFWPFMIYLPIYFQSSLHYSSTVTGISLLAYSLPTLLFPPIGEKLALRFNPRVVIPCGLLTIGIGFLLMWWGSQSSTPSWLTMLPGLLVAGVGLGITNTPVTNTSTASVDLARTGMASGIDMSARMITLSINISLMGFILAEGVTAYLVKSAPEVSDISDLRLIAERLAAGAENSGTVLASVGPEIAQNALSHGFGAVMLYGAIAVSTLALASFLAFGYRKF